MGEFASSVAIAPLRLICSLVFAATFSALGLFVSPSRAFVEAPVRQGLEAKAVAYDALDRVTSETSRGLTNTHAYELAGNLVETHYSSGASVTRTYNDLNLIESQSDDAHRITQWHYDLAGRAVGLVLPNGQVQENEYDDAGRLVERRLKAIGGVSLAEFTWTHDAAGNVLGQSESWPGDPARAAGSRLTTMAYDEANRLLTETVTAPGQPVTTTAYSYDEADNRIAKSISEGGTVQTATEYTYNSANQLVSWTEHDGDEEVLRSATLGYDNRGNRNAQTITLADTTQQATSYQWDFQNRLVAVTLPDATDHTYAYDYRTRRISRAEPAGATAVSWSGGLSLAEYAVSGLQGTVANALAPSVEYRRGPDMGGGIGGLLHSLRGGAAKYNLGNGRGDVVAQSDESGALTWTASYEAFGKRPVETGSNADRQRANTKEEDPTGLLWEHFRYRDLETGVWLSRDPAGFVDGPNLYAYVRQNPWTFWDPEGLSIWTKAIKFAKNGGDIGMTTAGLVSDFNAFKGAKTFGQAIVPAMSMLSEVLPVSVGDVKDGLKLAKKGIDSLGDAKSVDNVAEASKEGGMKLNAASKKRAGESGHVGTGNKTKKESPYESARDNVPGTGGKNFDEARRQGFEEAGMTDPSKVQFTEIDPETGTVVGFKGEGGAKVVYDGPHPDTPGPYHDVHHVGRQTPGKTSNGGRERKNIPYEGPQHPSRSVDSEVDSH